MKYMKTGRFYAVTLNNIVICMAYMYTAFFCLFPVLVAASGGVFAVIWLWSLHCLYSGVLSVPLLATKKWIVVRICSVNCARACCILQQHLQTAANTIKWQK